MIQPSPRLDPKRGVRVRWLPAGTEVWREGKLLRDSPTHEEWLVKSDTGQQYWIHVNRLRPADER